MLRTVLLLIFSSSKETPFLRTIIISLRSVTVLNLVTMSSNNIFAEPMLDSEEYLEEYMQQITELGDKGLLPNLDETLCYKVYSIRRSEFGAHKSIVLTTDEEHFLTVELGFHEVNGRKHIYPVTKHLDSSYKEKMEYLGKINEKGADLIGKAVSVMKQFGSYFKFGNNCQNFCNMYLEAIGLAKAKSLTDQDKAAIKLMLGAGGIALMVIALKKIRQNTK